MRCTLIRICLFLAGLLGISSGASGQCGIQQFNILVFGDTLTSSAIGGNLRVAGPVPPSGWQSIDTAWSVDGAYTNSDTVFHLAGIPEAGIHYVEAAVTLVNPLTGDTCSLKKGNYFLTTVQNLFATIETNGSGLTQGFQARFYGSDFPVNPVWNFGDGTLMNGASSSHTFAQPGVYKVTFTTGNGSLSSASRWIHAGDGHDNFILTTAGMQQPACDSVQLIPVTQIPYSYISSDDVFNFNYLVSPVVLTGNFSGYNQYVAAPFSFGGKYHLPGQTLLYCKMLDSFGGDYTIYTPVIINDTCMAVPDTLAGYFWSDEDADGLRDPSEPFFSEPDYAVRVITNSAVPDVKGKYAITLPGIVADAAPVATNGNAFTTPERYSSIPSGSGLLNKFHCGVALQQTAVSGKLYVDVNSDTVYNSMLDKPAESFTIAIQHATTGAIHYAVTNRTGDYSAIVPQGNYKVYLKSEVQGSQPVPDTQLISLTSANVAMSPVAIQAVQPTSDLDAILIPGMTPVAGEPFSLYLLTRNNGNDTCKGQFQVAYDANLQFSSIYPANGIHDPVNHTVTWYGQTLYPYTDSLYRISFMLAAVTTADSLVNQSYLYVSPGFTDVNLQNNAFACTTKIGNQQLPFTKMATPEGTGTPHYISAGSKIYYHLRYDNQGPGVQRNIILQDEISAWLDLATLRVEYSSHPMKLNTRGHVLTFSYYNINLPDTGSGSASVIDLIFSAASYPFTPGGTAINNTAYLYPDQLLPLSSNTINQTIDLTSGLGTNSEEGIVVYPNPFTDRFIIAGKALRREEIKLTDITGRVIAMEVTGDQNNFNCSTVNLMAGTYLLQIKAGKEIYTYRLVKNR